MTIEERAQEFFNAIERGEDPLQDLLAERRKRFAQRRTVTPELYRDIEWCWSIDESQHAVQFQLDRMADLRKKPRYKVTEEQVTAVYYASQWMMYMEHIVTENNLLRGIDQ